MYPGFISYRSNRRENCKSKQTQNRKNGTLHFKKLGTFWPKKSDIKTNLCNNCNFYNRTYSFKHQNIMFKTKIQRIKKNFEALILGVFSIIFKEINLLFVIIPLRSKVDGRDYLY